MSGRISNLFTSLTAESEKSRATAAMYVDNTTIHDLFNLIKKHGKFYLKSTNAGFEVGLGEYRFTIEDFMDLLKLTLHEVSTLSREDADITATLANILLPHNEKPIQLQASALDDERRLWVAAVKIMKRDIKAFNQDQRLRFDFLTKKYAQKLALNISTSKAEHDQHIAGNNTPSFGGMMGGFLQTDKTGHGMASIYVENDALGFLMNLAIEYGELEINFDSTQFMISLKGIIFGISFDKEFGKLVLLSPMTIGAAAIMLRILRFMHSDFELDKVRNLEFDVPNEADEVILLKEIFKQDDFKYQFRFKNDLQKFRIERFMVKYKKERLWQKQNLFSFQNAVKESEAKNNTPDENNKPNPP